MSLNDPLANALSEIMRYDNMGRKEILIKPMSKVIKKVLEILNHNGYVGTYDEIDEGRGKYLKLNLIGMVNECKVIKPRFPVKFQDIEKCETKHLPAKGFGILIISTPQGIMTHDDAAAKKIGGALIAYCY